MPPSTFDILILNGRPAAGKSEVIDYLKKVPLGERIRRFHIGEFEEIDDFPILWERFEDDDLYERHGRERKYSDTEFIYKGQRHKGYVFKEKFFWNFLIEKLNLAYEKRFLRERRQGCTAIIEFSRGSEHGGFREAYQHLSDAVLSCAATLYIQVSFEESLRKNRRRYNPDRPDSILQHALEDTKLEMLYGESDWEDFSRPDPTHLIVKGHRIPYYVLQNEPEITDKPDLLGIELDKAFQTLWRLRNP